MFGPQEERANRIAGEMKRLRFIPPTWTPEDGQHATPPAHRVTPTVDSVIERREGGGERALKPEKLNKLLEYLMNIEEIPVCRLRPSLLLHCHRFDGVCSISLHRAICLASHI